MDSKSSSSDDEEICKLMEAVAPTFKIQPTHNRYKSDKSNGKQGCAKEFGSSADKSDKLIRPKTNRTDLKDAEEKWNSGHFESVDISSETQNFIAKKLSAALDKQIEEQLQDHLSIKSKSCSEIEETEESAGGILLFSNSSSKLTQLDFDKTAAAACPEKKKTKWENVDRIKSSRSRKRKLMMDTEESDDEQTKLKSVAVSSDWVLCAK